MPTKVVERHAHPKYPRLAVQLRSDSKFYQAVIFLDGKLRQHSTKTTNLPTAFKLAEDWYRRQLRASVALAKEHPIAQLTSDPTFAELFRSYLGELDKSKRPYAEQKWGPIADFWRTKLLSDLNAGIFKQFYGWRRKSNGNLSNHTLHKDVVLIRQILKHAMHSDVLDALPKIPPVGSIKANPRPWLTPAEYGRLWKLALQRIKDAPNKRVHQQRQDLLDVIEFLHGSMMRVGELRKLRFRNCRVERNKDGDLMLLCEVTGKRGTRTCVALVGCAQIYQRRIKGKSMDDVIFPSPCHHAFRELLKAADLRTDDHGFERNLKSIRATAISSMLLEHPNMNLTLLARNAGTSVAMIDTFYAKRLTAEMHKDALSALPDALSIKKIRARERRLAKKEGRKPDFTTDEVW